MKYIHSEYSQFKHVSNSDALRLMESMGYNTDSEVVDIIDYMKHDTSYYALSQTVVESDEGIFLKVDELPGNSVLDESTHSYITEVEYDGGDYSLHGIYESSDGVYTMLVPVEKDEEEEEIMESFIEYDGDTYRVVESEEEADYIMFVTDTDNEGEYTVVEESDSYDNVLYLAVVREDKEKGYKNGKKNGKKDDGESKGDKGKDKDDPDAKDYENGGDRKGDEGAGKDKDDKPDFTTGARKGDKSKTHSGKDFEKNGNGNGNGDDDDENGDSCAFGGKKGDKSQTHGGLDFKSLKKKAKK